MKRKNDTFVNWGKETGKIYILRIKCPDLSRPNGEGHNDGFLTLLYVKW